MKKILIIGSNFGSKTYLKVLSKFNNLFKIYICSPNIYRKKINKKIIKYKSYEKAIFENNFKFIICAATPSVQSKVLQYLNKNKTKLNGILLEKPLSQNFSQIKNSISIINKNKIPFLLNFIFTELESYKKLKKIIKINKIKEIDYTWTFKQAYFKNKIPTWKINDKLGGGLIKFYGIHAIFNLVELLNVNKLLSFKIEDITHKKKLIYSLKTKIYYKKIKINLFININSKKNLHQILFKCRNNNIELLNKSKDWTKGFKLIKNKNTFIFKKESRIRLVEKIINNLIFNNKIKRNKINLEYLNKVLVAHLLCEKIHKSSKIII